MARAGRGGRDAKASMTALVSELRGTVTYKSQIVPLEKLLKPRKVVEVLDRPNLRCDGFLAPIGTAFQDGFRLVVNESVRNRRKRFTVAHEICHTFFYEYVPEIKFAPHDVDEVEESLCNHGAAELLMPSRSVVRQARTMPICLGSLESLANRYAVSSDAMMLRLRSLRLWNAELSTWTLMTNGTFAVDRITGSRRVDWRWTDETPLWDAWTTGRPRAGHTLIEYLDNEGRRFIRPLSYELERRKNRLIVLWGKGVIPSRESTTLFVQKVNRSRK